MKKTLVVLLASVLAFINVNSVKAYYYTYDEGQEVKITLNDSDVSNQFYIVSDNGDTVTAILKGTLGDGVSWNTSPSGTCAYENSEVDKKLKERTAGWSYASDIHLPSATEIIPNFDFTDMDQLQDLIEESDGVDVRYIKLENLNKKVAFYTENASGKWYYTSSVTEVRGSLDEGCNIYSYTQIGEFERSLYFHVVTSIKGEIRPIITISKDHIEGSKHTDDKKNVWEQYVKEFISTDLANEEDSKVMISHTDDSLVIDTLTKDEDGATVKITTKFKYANGILIYEPTYGSDASKALVDKFWINNVISALSSYKNYEDAKVNEFLKKAENVAFNIDKQGIEFSTKVLNSTGGGQPVEAYEKFMVNVDKGLDFSSVSSDNGGNDDNGGNGGGNTGGNTTGGNTTGGNTTDNPNTGDIRAVTIISLLTIAGSASVVYLSTRKKTKFPQA